MKVDSRRIFWIILNIAMALLILGMLVGIKALYRYGASLSPSRTIYVSAEGKVVVVPDIANVSFSVISEGANPILIQNNNIQTMNQVIEYVKNQGIDDKDIKTTQYSLSPKYEYDEKKKKSFISGYELRQSVQLKIRDFSKISNVLGKLPELGVNEIGALQFDVDDPDAYLDEARQEAFAKARVKAEAMAEQNGVRIKRVVTFSESPIFYPAFLRAESVKGGFGGDGAPSPVPTVEPGSREVTVNVAVTYEIK